MTRRARELRRHRRPGSLRRLDDGAILSSSAAPPRARRDVGGARSSAALPGSPNAIEDPHVVGGGPSRPQQSRPEAHGFFPEPAGGRHLAGADCPDGFVAITTLRFPGRDLGQVAAAGAPALPPSGPVAGLLRLPTQRIGSSSAAAPPGLLASAASVSQKELAPSECPSTTASTSSLDHIAPHLAGERPGLALVHVWRRTRTAVPRRSLDHL